MVQIWAERAFLQERPDTPFCASRSACQLSANFDWSVMDSVTTFAGHIGLCHHFQQGGQIVNRWDTSIVVLFIRLYHLEFFLRLPQWYDVHIHLQCAYFQ